MSVSSQSDLERADLQRESRELTESPEAETAELAEIYSNRGVESGLAQELAKQLMAKDPLEAHARDELGISEISTARPIQAALTSGTSFSLGAAAPLLLGLVSPWNHLTPIVAVGSIRARAARISRCSHGRRESFASHCTCDLLGRSSHGAYRLHRCLVWNFYVSSSCE